MGDLTAAYFYQTPLAAQSTPAVLHCTKGYKAKQMPPLDLDAAEGWRTDLIACAYARAGGLTGEGVRYLAFRHIAGYQVHDDDKRAAAA